MKSSLFKKYVWLTVILIFATGLSTNIFSQDAKDKDPLAPIENLSFQAAEIRSVIRFLADYGNVNVVVAPKVQGQFTINLSKEQTEIEQHNSQQLSLAKLEVKIVRLANTAAAEISESVKSLMTDRGKVDADERTNSLILQEVPENLDRVIDFIKELDRPARQIKISAQMLEIYNTNDVEFGVDWTASGSWSPENSNRTVSQTMTQDGDRVTDKFITYDIGALMNGWSVDAVVSAIVGESKGKVIAHPEITTIENKMATIQMGQKIPIKQFDQSGNVVIQFEDVGTILRVTPHITATNQILMHLIPERSSIEPDPSGIIINTSNAETNVVVNNGQTAVIGGLTSQVEVEATSGIPILKDIPLIGALFRYTEKHYEDRDLVIFVTPTIVEDDLADAGL